MHRYFFSYWDGFRCSPDSRHMDFKSPINDKGRLEQAHTAIAAIEGQIASLLEHEPKGLIKVLGYQYIGLVDEED